MDLFDRIQTLAKNKGTNISTIEKELNLGACTISKWKKSDPSSRKLLSVASYLGVTVEYLLTGEEYIGGHAESSFGEYSYSYFYCDETGHYDERWVLDMWRHATNDEKGDLIYFFKKIEDRLSKEKVPVESSRSEIA